jgi:hypothetical protein
MKGDKMTKIYSIHDEKVPLEKAQELVGGYVEVVRLRNAALLVDEDGLMKGLEMNAAAMRLVGDGTLIVGDVVLLQGKTALDGWTL